MFLDFEEKRKLTAFFVSAVIAVNTAVIAVNTAATPAVYAAETGLTGGNEAVTSGISENTALSNNTALSDNTALNSDTTVSTNTNISENTAAGDNTAISENTVSSDTAISSNGASEEDAGEMDDAAQDIPFAALDDETVVENPEPLPEFMTTLTEGDGKQDVTGENTETNTALKAGQALIRSALNAKETASYISEPAAGASDYAVEYSSKDMGYLPDITINQSPSSLCWAFTASMLAEISLIRKGLIGKTETFSADQTGYFFYNRITDPLGGTEGDKNNLLGNYTYYYRGGNNSFNTWSLASWISERDSSIMPFTGSVYTSVSDDNAYNADAHLQNAYWASMYSAAGNIDYIENVKELIYNYGGVSAIIYSGRSINANHAVYSTTTTGGHNVTLIGWDDNFSADKFTVTPPGNGAWYVRDSYDGGTNMEEGCYWLSYYDRSLTGPSSAKAIAFDFDKGDNYDNNYQYDGAAGNTTISSSSERIRVANVFRAKGSEYLEAVGFAPASTEMSYEVDIYKLEEGYSSPINGESLSKTTGETRYVGYRTIELSEPVALSANDIFSVVITATDTSGNNRAKVYVDQSGTNSNWISFTSSVGEGESYYYNTDLKAYGYNVRIKAYTGNAVGEEKTNKRSYAKAEFDIGEYTYDGTLHTPEVTVKKGADGSGDTLIKGNDYTVSCVNNKYAGTATVKVLSDKYYIRDNIRTFTIKPRQMEQNVTASANETLYVYDTTAHKPGVKVTDEKLNGSPVTLKENRDYTVSYEDNVNAGAARAVITGEGNYTGSVYAGFTVESADIGTCDLEGIEDEVYTGVDITPTINGTFMDTERLENGKDFTVSYSGNINVGTATAAVYGKGNYSGSRMLTFKITPKALSGFSYEGIKTAYEYDDGKEITPKPVVTDTENGRVLSEGTDYTLSYADNKEEGDAKLTVSGRGNYTGTKEMGFFISKADPIELTVANIPDQTFVPGGSGLTPAVRVKNGSGILNPGSDYTVSYVNNTGAGTATVNITGVAKTIYDNSSVSKDFIIKPFSISKAVVEGISDKLYEEGRTYTVSPLITVKSPVTGEAFDLVEGVDYTISYEGNTASKLNQKVTVLIEGKGNYTGQLKKSFRLLSSLTLNDTDLFDISLSQTVYSYDGTKKNPEVKVIYKPDGRELVKGTDYTVSYAANKNAGIAKVTIKPKGSFAKDHLIKGSAVRYFKITGKSAEGATYNAIPDKTYTGKAIKPAVRVKINGKNLSSVYYYVEYEDNVNAGTAKFTVYGRKNYSGVIVTGTFKINRRSFKNVRAAFNKKTGVLKVRYGNAVLREGIDYTKDSVTRTITSLKTNFEEGVKKY